MRILKVISLLLDYPSATLVEGRDELEQAIIQAREISPKQRGALFELLELICNNDLMDGQEHYGALFGRGRSLSLLLFEHVHGESRDRGQAMVDMLAQYEAAGFAIGIKELPDYIPLYLEFLSTRDDLEAREGGRCRAPLGLARGAPGGARERLRQLLARLAANRRRGAAPGGGRPARAGGGRAARRLPRSPGQGLGRGGSGLSQGRAAGTLQRHAKRAGQAPGGKRGTAALGGFSASGWPPRQPGRWAMSKWNLLVFGIYPYVALAICLLGSWARFDLSQYSWKAGSSQMLDNRGMRVASNLFHVGVLFVLAGHFVGLLTPASVYHHVISTEHKQLLAMVSGGFFGLLCLIGLLMLIKRRLTDPRVRATSSPSDILILLVLLAQLLLGLLTIVASTAHMDGSVMVMLADWAQNTVMLRPMDAAAAIAPVGLTYKLHVFLGLTLFVLFPFTRLVHMVSAPVWYLGRRYQIVRQKI